MDGALTVLVATELAITPFGLLVQRGLSDKILKARVGLFVAGCLEFAMLPEIFCKAKDCA